MSLTKAPSDFPTSRQWLMGSVYTVASFAAAYHMRLGPASVATGELMAPIAQNARYEFAESKVILRRHYTGLSAIDTVLSFLVAAFLPGAAGWNQSFQLLQAYFLFSFFAIIAVWSIEAGRSRHASAIISFTSLWAIPYQTIGGAVIVPLWFLAHVFATSRSSYWDGSWDLSLAQAKALLPALVIGYLIPTILVFWPFQDINLQQFMIALWQPSPFFVNALWWLISKLLGSRKTRIHRGLHDDLPYINAIYIVAFLVSVTTHIAIMIICASSTDIVATLGAVFIPVHEDIWSLDGALLFIFQYDFLIIFGASTLWCYLAVWDLKRLKMTSVQVWRAVVVQTLGLVLLGPGALLCTVWYWREGRMAKNASKTKKL